MDSDVVHAQVIVAQRQSLLQSLINLHSDALRLVLSGKAEEILHDAMGALGLLVKFVSVLDSLLPHLSAGGQQLAVTEDGGQGVVQFVRHSGDQLSHGCQLLTVEQLFLRAAQVFVGLAGLFIEIRALDGAGNLATHSNEQVHVGWRKLPRRAAADNHTADDPVFRPQDDDVNRLELFSCLDVAENLRQYQALHGKERRVRNLNVLHQLRFHWNGWKTF